MKIPRNRDFVLGYPQRKIRLKIGSRCSRVIPLYRAEFYATQAGHCSDI